MLGISYLLYKNVDKWLFFWLLIFGMIGGVLGVYVLFLFDVSVVKFFVLIYFVVIGFYILWCGIFYLLKIKDVKLIVLFGLFGGFFDVVGGGGWGLVVILNLLI